MGGVTITLNCDCHRKIKSVLQFPQLLLPTTLSAPFQNSLHASYLHFYVARLPNLFMQTQLFMKNPGKNIACFTETRRYIHLS